MRQRELPAIVRGLEHRVTPLIHTSTCRIDRCTCGAIHVTVAGTTVRIREDAARELRDALVRAMAEIDTRKTSPRTGSPRPYRVVLPGDEPEPDDEGGGTSGGDGGGGQTVH